MKNYDKNELEEIVKKSLSISEVCRYFKVIPAGGNFKTIKKYLKIFEIDTSHFTGKGWNRGDRYRSFAKVCSLEEILVKDSTYTNTHHLKIKLIKNGIKEYKCEECGISKWKNKKLSLHLDHINGDNLDNRIENLRILCPNCHSQTETYCKSKTNLFKLRKTIMKTERKEKQIKPEIQKNYCSCGKEIEKRSKRCPSCDKIKQRKVKDRPPREELMLMIKETSLESVGRKYGVSGNAVKKWLR